MIKQTTGILEISFNDLGGMVVAPKIDWSIAPKSTLEFELREYLEVACNAVQAEFERRHPKEIQQPKQTKNKRKAAK
jgi:hypothetical protein